MPNPEITAVDPYDPRRDRDPREPVDVPKREEPEDDPVEDPLEQPPIHDPGEIPEDEPVRRDPDPREPAGRSERASQKVTVYARSTAETRRPSRWPPVSKKSRPAR